MSVVQSERHFLPCSIYPGMLYYLAALPPVRPARINYHTDIVNGELSGAKDAVTSGFVNEMFTIYLDVKSQPIFVIYLQFTLWKKAKQCILTICKKKCISY